MGPRSVEDDFGDRLRSAMERGDLTISDLANWFDRSVPTVRYWVKHGTGVYAVGAVSKALIYSRLALLEQWVKTTAPPAMPRTERPRYIAGVRDELERLSTAHTAR
jgi:hypothetical protein